jgi:predicted aldo/keto reductase-like oxidoreductase
VKRRSFLQGMGAVSMTVPIAGCSNITGSKYKKIEPKGIIPKRILGKTEIKVSVLGFGSHMKREIIAQPKLRDRMIKLGYEGGINLFDVYDHSDYHQFKPMGISLRGFRKSVYVSLCIVKNTNEMQAEIDGALNDFYTDYIDLYRLYSVDDDRINILEKAKQAGKIRAIGVVSHDEPTMQGYINQYGDHLDFVMIVYNFHHNKGNPEVKNYPYNDYSALIPRCGRLNLGIIGIKPMGSDAMIELAKEENFFRDNKGNIAKAMLRYIYAAEEIDCTIPAMNSIDEVKTNLQSAYNPVLSDYERLMLSNLSNIAARKKEAYLPPHYKWLERWAMKISTNCEV